LSSGAKGIFNGVKSGFGYFGPDTVGNQFVKYLNKKYANLKNETAFLDKGTFEESLSKARQARKPLLVYVHQDNQLFGAIPNLVFADKKITEILKKSFQTMGVLVNSEKSNFISKFVPTKDIPCLAFFRTNILDEPAIVEIITLESSTNPRELADKIKGAEINFRNIEKEELKVKRNVDQGIQLERQLAQAINNPIIMNPFMFPMGNQQNDPFFMGFPQQNSPGVQPRQMDPAMQQKLEEDRILRQIQEEDYKEVERKIKQQKQKEADVKDKKKRDEEEKVQKEQLALLEKEQKRQSLPVEPAESDPNHILIIFRLPDGSRVNRRFDRNNRVQVLYDYVDVQDVQFEHTNVYDLIQPHPFVSLSDKEKTINDYFEGSSHENLNVREQV